ncbi:MAG: retroviral-like aspartic protease family protein [Bacteroidales bacterium]|nr:retroviral-like aspartic protease family protein [Bacteroidales bacterium]
MRPSSPGTIRLNAISSGQIVVSATLNGVRGRFVLDTGSGRTIIEQSKKEKFLITDDEISQTSETAIGAGSSGIFLEIATLRTFTIAHQKVKNIPLFLMDLSHVNQGFAEAGIKAIDGIIGGDLLFTLHAIVDYSHMKLTLQK